MKIKFICVTVNKENKSKYQVKYTNVKIEREIQILFEYFNIVSRTFISIIQSCSITRIFARKNIS